MPEPHPNFLRAALAGQYDRQAAEDELLADDHKNGDCLGPPMCPHCRAERREEARGGYDPVLDVLLVETCDGEWTLVPPWRCAMSVRDHLPKAGVDGLLATLRAWHTNLHDERGQLVVWELLSGEQRLQRAD